MITRPVPYSIQKTGRLLVFLALIVFSICQVSVSDSSPEITNIVFCKNVDDSGDPVDQIDMFPSGTSEIMAWFAYENIPQSPSWGYRLYQGNDLILTENYPTWGWDDNGSAHRNFTKEDGFEDGTYTLAFVMNNEEIGSGSFIVGGADPEENLPETEKSGNSGSFGRIIFAEGVTDESAPIGESDTLIPE